MAEYFKSFDLVLNTTPYNLWMWLKDETKYKKPDSKEGNSIPLLKPPRIIIEEEGWWYVEGKTCFIPSRLTRVTTPLPHDEQAIFTMVHEELYLNNDGRVSRGAPESEIDSIRISMKSVDDNCTQAIGDYWTKFPVLAEYMNQIRDQLVNVFSEGERIQISGDEISKEKAKRKARADMLQRVAEAYFLVNEKRYSRSEAAALMHTSTSSMANYDPQNEGEGNAIVKEKLDFIRKNKEEQSRIHLKAIEERKLKREK